MMEVGYIHIGSLLYLSGVISFAVSLNENRISRTILTETLRRWGKFLGLTVVIALVVHLLSR